MLRLKVMRLVVVVLIAFMRKSPCPLGGDSVGCYTYTSAEPAGFFKQSWNYFLFA